MNGIDQIIAKKYARAWLNLFSDRIKKSDLDNIEEGASFLRKNTRILFFLRLSMVDRATKLKVLNTLTTKANLPAELEILTGLLVNDNRAFLYPEVLTWIARLYKRINHIAQFVVESATPLSESDNTIIREFLASKTQCDIIYESKVSKDLIAGIRVQSKLWLWEHSLAQQLRRMRAAALQ